MSLLNQDLQTIKRLQKMFTFHNPALSEESRYEPARIIQLTENEPLLNWLKRKGRIKSFESDQSHDNDVLEELENIEQIIEISISDLEQEEEEE